MSGGVFGLVITGIATGAAVKQAIAAQPDIELRLAEAAIPVAVAAVLRGFAVQAPKFGFGGRHGKTVARQVPGKKCRW
jgi:hypothetical protein